MKPVLRGGRYSIRVRVPARYRDLSRSSHVWRSLGTDSLELAQQRAPQIRTNLLAEWAAAAGAIASASPADRYRQIADLASARGFIYQTSTELAAGPIERALERIEFAGADASLETTAALLGGIQRPVTLVSSLPALVEKFDAVAIAEMSKEQRRVKLGGFRRCARLFVDHVGDCPITEVDRYGALTLRDALQERVLSEDKKIRIKADTANKYMHGLAAMLSKILLKEKLPDSYPFHRIMLPTSGKAQRLPFNDNWIREHILAPDALADINDEARDITIIMAVTGARPSEVTDVLPHHIHLDDLVPHVWVRPEGRKLKTEFLRAAAGSRRRRDLRDAPAPGGLSAIPRQADVLLRDDQQAPA